MSTPTTVIIGGGVTALSTAYHLAVKKHGKIVVVDKGPVGDGSSSRAAAIATGLLWSETGVRARQLALRRFRELSDELCGYEFQARGCLNTFDESSWPEREALLPLYDRLGAPYEILDSAQIAQRWPDLNPAPSIKGLFDPLGGYSEPDEYLPALQRKCCELGVEIRENEAVTGIILRDGRAAGVRTATGDISADAVVSSIYAWTLQILEPLGIRLPIKSFVHQRFVTKPLAQPLNIPPVNANTLFGYFRPAAGNRILLGLETAEREEHRVTSPGFHMDELTVDPGLKDTLRRNMTDMLPVLVKAEWDYQKVGLINFAIDGEPVLGPIGAVPGLFVGLAFHSGGFAYSPATGYLLAELVADGKTSLDITAFSPDRFDADATEAYLADTVIQANAARRRH